MGIVRRNPDVLWRVEEAARDSAIRALESGGDAAGVGTAVLFANDEMLALNLLGEEIWRRCDGVSVEEIVASLLEEFEIGEGELAADVSEFLDQLEAKGFLYHER